jgi:hypothetical protein
VRENLEEKRLFSSPRIFAFLVAENMDQQMCYRCICTSFRVMAIKVSKLDGVFTPSIQKYSHNHRKGLHRLSKRDLDGPKHRDNCNTSIMRIYSVCRGFIKFSLRRIDALFPLDNSRCYIEKYTGYPEPRETESIITIE